MSEKQLTENEMKALISLLGDSDPEVVSHVENRIVSLGGAVIPMLEREWEQSFDPFSQKRIEEIIHSLQFGRLLEKFRAWKESGAEDLLEGLWLLAAYQYPDLDFHKIKEQVQQIYYEAWLEFKPDVQPKEQIMILNSVIFNKLKFGPDEKHPTSISNNMINLVLDSKKGNSITLACIYMLVAQKMRLPVFGVDLPEHFVLTYRDEKSQFYINVFYKGLLFTRNEIDLYLKKLKLDSNDRFYEPCGHVVIIRRLMRNMMLTFENTGEHEKQKEIRELLNAISEDESSFDAQ
jgi:regulator of sirC expression with transglutaminase-like and TPR domain